MEFIPGKILVFCTFVLFFTIVNSETQNPKILSLHITSDIKYRFATTLVTSVVANSDNTSVEAHFEVTLPDAAFITHFVMEIDGKLYTGEINEKETAKKKYETAKKKGQSAGHVAQKPRHTNRFGVDVNVAAKSKVTFNLTYQELLERVYGEYEHIIYIDPGQIVEDFRINVAILESRDLTKVSVPPIRNDIILESNIEEGKNALVTIERPTSKWATIHYSPTTEDQQEQSDQGISGLFVVEYDIEREKDAGDILVVDGYFVHFFAPDGMEPIPKDVLFVLDVSGSMSGKKIQQQSEAMVSILKDLHEGDSFNIMKFSSSYQLWNPTFVSVTRDNIKTAQQYAKSMSAGGSTGINKALLKGISILNKIENENNRMKLIIFLTDGMADSSRDYILENVKNANKEGIAIFSLGFGNNADYEFIKKLALKNKGIARKIFEDSDATLQIKGFYDEISSASLKNVTFKYLNNEEESIVENATKWNFNAFFNGKEIVIAGKLADNEVKVVDLVVSGNGIDGDVELTLESDVQSSIPELTKKGDFAKITSRIWAYMTIKQLLEEAIGEEDANRKQSLNERALDLSLKYKFVTPLTSMVVTKPDESDIGALEDDEDAKLAIASSKRQTSTAQRQQHPGRGGGGAIASSKRKTSTAQRQQYSSSSRRGGGGGGGGGSRGGGGGGDPHFMIRIDGIQFPLCFDLDAREGDVLQMLNDPISGVLINAGVISSNLKNKKGEYKTFIGEIVLKTSAVRIHVKPTDIVFNSVSLSWDYEHVYQIDDVSIRVKANGRFDRTVKIDFGNEIIVSIRRYMTNDTNMDVNYLNLYIEEEYGISDIAGGLLGQFVHRKTTLFKVTLDRRGRKHGHFREVENKHKTHFNTILHSKPDILTGKMIECWNAHRKITGLLDDDIGKYFVSDIEIS